MPWYILINSSRRIGKMKSFGLISITNLPRSTFPGTRVQTCILDLKKGYQGKTEFRNYLRAGAGQELLLKNV